MPEKSTSETCLAKRNGFILSNYDFRFAITNFGANKFNALPNHIKPSQSLKSFKSAGPKPYPLTLKLNFTNFIPIIC